MSKIAARLMLSALTFALIATPASAQSHNISAILQSARGGDGGRAGNAWAGNGGYALAEGRNNTARANGGWAYSGSGGRGGAASNTASMTRMSGISVVAQEAQGGNGGNGGSAYAGSGGGAAAVGYGNTATANGGSAYAGNGGNGGSATNTVR